MWVGTVDEGGVGVGCIGIEGGCWNRQQVVFGRLPSALVEQAQAQEGEEWQGGLRCLPARELEEIDEYALLGGRRLLVLGLLGPLVLVELLRMWGFEYLLLGGLVVEEAESGLTKVVSC